MIKIGIVGLTSQAQAEGYFAAYGCNDEWMKMIAFSRGILETTFPGNIKINDQEIDFQMLLIQHHEQQGIFTFTTNCDGYVIVVESANYKKAMFEELVANILTYEKKTLQEVPIHIVLVDKGNNDEVRQLAESKSIPFSHIHIITTIGEEQLPDRTTEVRGVLSSLLGRVLPNLGTDRVLKAPPQQ